MCEKIAGREEEGRERRERGKGHVVQGTRGKAEREMRERREGCKSHPLSIHTEQIK